MASFVRPDTLPQAPKRLSKWEKADIRTERRTRMSKYELLREDIADRLRCPLCFCLPCVIIIFILLILIGIYVVQPYIQGKRIFIQSQSVSLMFGARVRKTLMADNRVYRTVNIPAICRVITQPSADCVDFHLA